MMACIFKVPARLYDTCPCWGHPKALIFNLLSPFPSHQQLCRPFHSLRPQIAKPNFLNDNDMVQEITRRCFVWWLRVHQSIRRHRVLANGERLNEPAGLPKGRAPGFFTCRNLMISPCSVYEFVWHVIELIPGKRETTCVPFQHFLKEKLFRSFDFWPGWCQSRVNWTPIATPWSRMPRKKWWAVSIASMHTGGQSSSLSVNITRPYLIIRPDTNLDG